jgi:hypothetical protein
MSRCNPEDPAQPHAASPQPGSGAKADSGILTRIGSRGLAAPTQPVPTAAAGNQTMHMLRQLGLARPRANLPITTLVSDINVVH